MFGFLCFSFIEKFLLFLFIQRQIHEMHIFQDLDLLSMEEYRRAQMRYCMKTKLY